jgi:biopolymer transport protein ExbB/TolQ
MMNQAIKSSLNRHTIAAGLAVAILATVAGIVAYTSEARPAEIGSSLGR